MASPIITEGVAGPFTATWAPSGSNPVTLGVIGNKGIREIRRYESEEVGADLLGNSIVDAVHIGSQLFLEFELEEANLINVQILSHPFAETSQSTLANALLGEGEHGVPGLYFTDKYGELVLTSGHGNSNSAGAQSTPKRTYGMVTMAPGFEFNQLLAARRKIVPLRLRCYPYLASAKYVFYTKAAL